MVGGILGGTACLAAVRPVKSSPSCSSWGPRDSASQNVRARGVDTAAGQRDKVPPRPLADPYDDEDVPIQ